MSFLDWIPVVSTIKHIMENPKGMRVSDYTCNMNSSVCQSANPASVSAAITQCNRDINKQLLKFIQNYIGGVPNAIIHDVVGDIAGVIIAYLTKQYLIKKGVSGAAGVSIPVIGVILVLDSFADLAIIISTLNRMKDAANRAKAICCKCTEEACSKAKMNTTPLVIKGTYLGPKRSFNQTEAEAQDYADINFNCKGTCSSGTCKPKIYIVEHDQSHFVLTRTTLKYDVYCECV